MPLSALGNPTDTSLFESVMAFVTASPQGGAVPQNNGADFADIAPLQLEGTKAFNFRFNAVPGTGPAAPLAPPAPAAPVAPPVPAQGPGGLAATGLATAVPLVAVALLLGALAVRRRRSAD